jgi:hypothetical protein
MWTRPQTPCQKLDEGCSWGLGNVPSVPLADGNGLSLSENPQPPFVIPSERSRRRLLRRPATRNLSCILFDRRLEIHSLPGVSAAQMQFCSVYAPAKTANAWANSDPEERSLVAKCLLPRPSPGRTLRSLGMTYAGGVICLAIVFRMMLLTHIPLRATLSSHTHRTHGSRSEEKI